MRNNPDQRIEAEVLDYAQVNALFVTGKFAYMFWLSRDFSEN
jgi:hypothetical protein